MQLFKRHNRNIVESESNRHIVISNYLEQRKRNFAAYLQQQSGLLSHKSRKIFLLFFIIIFIAASTAITIRAVFTTKGSLDIKQISKTSSASKIPLRIKRDSAITKRDYMRIELFKTYLLQLKNDSLNKAKFDSIMQLRPHLLDSITLFEKMYLSQ